MGTFFVKYKPVVLPVVIIWILVLITLVFGKPILGRIGVLRAEIASAESEVEKLSDKLTTLQEISAIIIPYSERAVVALPHINSGYLVLAQIRSEAAELEVSLNNISLNSTDQSMEDLDEIDVSFEAAGNLESVSTFVENLSFLLPVMNFKSVEIEERQGYVEAGVSLVSYWSPFPKELPPVTEPVSSLSSQEIKILNNLSVYNEPELGQSLSPVGGYIREDPFTSH